MCNRQVLLATQSHVEGLEPTQTQVARLAYCFDWWRDGIYPYRWCQDYTNWLHKGLRIKRCRASRLGTFYLFHKPIGDDISGFYGHLAVGFVLQGGLALHLMGPEVVNLIDSGIEGGAQVAHL